LFESLPIPDQILELIAIYSETYKYKEFVEELHGIAYYADVPFSLLLLTNFFAELATNNACTSIVLRDNKN